MYTHTYNNTRYPCIWSRSPNGDDKTEWEWWGSVCRTNRTHLHLYRWSHRVGTLLEMRCDYYPTPRKNEEIKTKNPIYPTHAERCVCYDFVSHEFIFHLIDYCHLNVWIVVGNYCRLGFFSRNKTFFSPCLNYKVYRFLVVELHCKSVVQCLLFMQFFYKFIWRLLSFVR